MDEAKKRVETAKKALAEKDAAAAAAKKRAAEKKAAAEEKKTDMLAKITDAKKKKLAEIASLAAIAGKKVRTLKIPAVAAANEISACDNICAKMKVTCADVVCEAKAKTRRLLLSQQYGVTVTPDPAKVDASAVEKNLVSDGTTTVVAEDADPIAILTVVVPDAASVSAFKSHAEEAVKADEEATKAANDANEARAEVAAAETSVKQAETHNLLNGSYVTSQVVSSGGASTTGGLLSRAAWPALAALAAMASAGAQMVFCV